MLIKKLPQSISVKDKKEDTGTPGWFVYLIENRLGHLYTGSTNDPVRRLRQHRGELAGGARALKGKSPLTYRLILKVDDKSAALRLEYAVKQLSRAQKNALIDGQSNQLLSHCFSRAALFSWP